MRCHVFHDHGCSIVDASSVIASFKLEKPAYSSADGNDVILTSSGMILAVHPSAAMPLTGLVGLGC